MHELSIAVSLVEEVEAILSKENAEKVLSLEVSIGEISGVEREPFEFCFPLAAEGTALEKARLEIKEVPAVVRCGDCQTQSHPEVPFFVCANCKSSNVRIEEGRDFLLTSLEVS